MAKKKKQNRRRDYEKYLDSTHWQNLRQEKFKTAPNCQNCGSDKYLHVHHIRYRNLIDCVVGDLVVLCVYCHKDFHKGVVRQCKKISECELPQIKEVIQFYRKHPKLKGSKAGPLSRLQIEVRKLIRSFCSRRFPAEGTRQFIDSLEEAYRNHSVGNLVQTIGEHGAHFEEGQMEEELEATSEQ